MLEVDGRLRTDDMALAAVLLCFGYTPELVRTAHKVEFVLPEEEVDRETHELVDEYLRGACRVEPVRFIREYVATRKQVYRLMDHHNAPRHTRLKRQSAT